MALSTQIQTMSNLFEGNKLAHLANNYTNSGGQKKANIASWRKVKTSVSVVKNENKWY